MTHAPTSDTDLEGLGNGESTFSGHSRNGSAVDFAFRATDERATGAGAKAATPAIEISAKRNYRGKRGGEREILADSAGSWTAISNWR